MTKPRLTPRRRAAHRLRAAVALTVAVGAVASCNRNPAAPQCLGALEIDLSTEEIHAGDTFTASATHRIPECTTTLNWTATGVIEFRVAEGTDATFLAREEGNGVITVRNRQGNLGVIQVEVVPPDEGDASGPSAVR